MIPPGDPAEGPRAAPGAVRVAALLMLLEAVGLGALGVIDLEKVVTGSPRSVIFAVIAALMALATAAILVLLSRALVRLRRRAYAPVIVLQALALPVGYSLAVQAGLWYYGGPILVLALAVLALLMTPSARQAVGPG